MKPVLAPFSPGTVTSTRSGPGMLWEIFTHAWHSSASPPASGGKDRTGFAEAAFSAVEKVGTALLLRPGVVSRLLVSMMSPSPASITKSTGMLITGWRLTAPAGGLQNPSRSSAWKTA